MKVVITAMSLLLATLGCLVYTSIRGLPFAGRPAAWLEQGGIAAFTFFFMSSVIWVNFFLLPGPFPYLASLAVAGAFTYFRFSRFGKPAGGLSHLLALAAAVLGFSFGVAVLELAVWNRGSELTDIGLLTQAFRDAFLADGFWLTASTLAVTGLGALIGYLWARNHSK